VRCGNRHRRRRGRSGAATHQNFSSIAHHLPAAHAGYLIAGGTGQVAVANIDNNFLNLEKDRIGIRL